LCGHNPFKEGIPGDDGTTDEQRAEIAEATKEKDRQCAHEYGKAARANPTDA